MNASVIVIGLYGQSALYAVRRLPQPGESVMSTALRFEPGGKGYNQALSAQRMGCATKFVTAVGEDAFGACAPERMKQDGLIDPCLFVIPGTNTAFASVLVDAQGENVVIVDRGACLAMTGAMLHTLEDSFVAASVLLVQCELPLEVLDEATAMAKKHGVLVILNPAPAADIPKPILERVDLLTPNWTEAHQLCRLPVQEDRAPAELAAMLREQGCPNVIITMGSRGAYLQEGQKGHFQPSFHVAAKDTTGAGDTFNGALAAELSNGSALTDALRVASAASAISVSRRGVLNAIPTKEEVRRFLSKQEKPPAGGRA